VLHRNIRTVLVPKKIKNIQALLTLILKKLTLPIENKFDNDGSGGNTVALF
jgi:hypothetical protein